MMHVRFNEAWHGKVQQTTLQIKWSSICNELHIDGTPHSSYLDLIFFMYPTILNVVKHGKRVRHNKTTPSKQFKWGRM